MTSMPFHEPPPAEVAARQPWAGDMMVDRHRRHIHTTGAGNARAAEKLGLCLAAEGIAYPAELRVELSHAIEQRSPHRHVGAERHALAFFEHERCGPVIEDRQRAPQI